MTKTCADCVFHECTSECTKGRRCNGVCVNTKLPRICSLSKCKFYEIDNFFLLENNFSFKETV